ncbi:UNVERIFIED_CONTAM: hypothetical protein Slati_0211000 [Sesamum latifolium]|uniref:Retrovirus-related Pol polyprotein from transposon TNT 1-94-like beta-barrel domain-containing protein n=1 Tax=Sesamum latifolium TaxID=2727402 RepID=A0AAW2YBW6_9LAMI
MKMMNQDFVKLVCFDGSNYPRWKDKMMFLLTFLKVAYILDLNQPTPEAKKNESNDAKVARLKREEDELLCRGHILNTLSDRLFDLYALMNQQQTSPTRKEKEGHIKKDCCFKKQKKEAPNVQVAKANVDEIVAMVINWYISFVTELNMTTAVQSNDWWYDSGATIHVCNDKNLFKIMRLQQKDKRFLWKCKHGSSKGSVEVHFTSGKKLLLTNVLHVPEI